MLNRVTDMGAMDTQCGDAEGVKHCVQLPFAGW